MNATASAPRTNAPVAAYFRAYPADRWLAATYRHAMERLAAERGLPTPAIFSDNGSRPKDERPALSSLLALVATGVYRAVLIPGPFVFALMDEDAEAVADQITSSGCELVELSAA